MGDFLSSLLDAWFRQVVSLLLLPAIVGALLHLTERATQANLERAIGQRGMIWWTGWLGTPIHELSHCVVGMLFGHKIEEVKFFDPHPQDGVLGYVRYSLPENPALRKVAVVGQFFSGIAPLFGGSLVLLLALKLLAPAPERAQDAAERFALALGHESLGDAAQGFLALVRGVYDGIFADGPASVRPWAFLYVALAVGAHLAPSPADLEGGAQGFGLLLVLALVVDAIALLAGAAPARAAGFLGQVAGAVSALLLFALVLNLGNLAFAFVVGQIAGRRRG